MDPETVTISEELLDLVVDGLSNLPYRDVQHIFSQLAKELEAAKPSIVTPH